MHLGNAYPSEVRMTTPDYVAIVAQSAWGKSARIGENAMLLTRREAMAGCAGGLASLLVSPAIAQAAYPSRTIKMIVPYPAGGTTDLLGRLVADQLKTGLGATVIVENKPGAGTTLGAEQVARSEPDGY